MFLIFLIVYVCKSGMLKQVEVYQKLLELYYRQL